MHRPHRRHGKAHHASLWAPLSVSLLVCCCQGHRSDRPPEVGDLTGVCGTIRAIAEVNVLYSRRGGLSKISNVLHWTRTHLYSAVRRAALSEAEFRTCSRLASHRSLCRVQNACGSSWCSAYNPPTAAAGAVPEVP